MAPPGGKRAARPTGKPATAPACCRVATGLVMLRGGVAEDTYCNGDVLLLISMTGGGCGGGGVPLLPASASVTACRPAQRQAPSAPSRAVEYSTASLSGGPSKWGRVLVCTSGSRRATTLPSPHAHVAHAAPPSGAPSACAARRSGQKRRPHAPRPDLLDVPQKS